MSVKIRLARHGAKKKPFYRIVVSDTRSPRDGRFIEQIGTYDPRVSPAAVTIKQERVDHWIGRGATPSRTVSELIHKLQKRAAESGGAA